PGLGGIGELVFDDDVGVVVSAVQVRTSGSGFRGDLEPLVVDLDGPTDSLVECVAPSPTAVRTGVRFEMDPRPSGELFDCLVEVEPLSLLEERVHVTRSE